MRRPCPHIPRRTARGASANLADAEEFVFECVVETEAAREVAYHFVLTHAYEEEQPQVRRWTH